jgi:hypothetical protein
MARLSAIATVLNVRLTPLCMTPPGTSFLFPLSHKTPFLLDLLKLVYPLVSNPTC